MYLYMEQNTQDHSTMDEQHKRSDRFDRKIAIRNLDGEQKSAIAAQIIDDMTIQLEYWSQMFLSIVVATLWLLINATPVVIGAMIIAPILRPIQAVWFATATWNRTLFWKSIWTLFLSILWWVFIAFLITISLPLTEITNEIAIRTQPTLVDLWIAFASWLVAFLAFWWKKMSAWLAWVAMAASLVPPLAVIWIWIWFGSLHIARWSTVLFLTNLIAIIIAGILIFYLFGFYPTQKDDLKRSLRNSVSALVMLVLLCIPLASSLVSITKNVHVQSTIKNTTNSFINNIDKRISLETLEVEKIDSTQEISLTLKVPQEVVKQLTEKEQTILTKKLAQALWEDIALDMRLLPVTKVSKISTIEVSLSEKIQQLTNNFITSLYHDKATLLDLTYYTNKKKIVVITLFVDRDFPTNNFSIAYDAYIKETYPEVEKTLINRQYETQTTWVELTPQQKLKKDIQDSFVSYFGETALHKIDVLSTQTHININIFASTPLTKDAYIIQIKNRETLLVDLYNKEIHTNNYITYLEKLEDEIEDTTWENIE